MSGQISLTAAYGYLIDQGLGLLELIHAGDWDGVIAHPSLPLMSESALTDLHSRAVVLEGERDLAASRLNELIKISAQVTRCLTERRDELAKLIAAGQKQAESGNYGKVFNGLVYGEKDIYRRKTNERRATG